MNLPSNVAIRNLCLSEHQNGVDFLAEAGFFKNKRCLWTMWHVDPQGIFIAIEQNGRIIGMCSAINHNDQLTSLGCFVVLPEYRGQAIGKLLWQAAIEHAGQRNVLFYSRVDIEPLYTKQGFSRTGFYHSIYSGHPNTDKLLKAIDSVAVVEISSHDKALLDKIHEYDSEIVGYSRRVFLERTAEEPETVRVAAVDEKTGRVLGYGFFAVNQANEVMPQPVYADNGQVAELLMASGLKRLPPGVVGSFWFTNLSNQHNVALLDKLDLKHLKTEPLLFGRSKINCLIDKIYCQSPAAFFPY